MWNRTIPPLYWLNPPLLESSADRTSAEPPPRQAVRNRPMPGCQKTYQPELDGMRAIAVLAVLLFHGVMSWLPGGFLGVDVFFVLSGYLITRLLLQEHLSTERIGLRA